MRKSVIPSRMEYGVYRSPHIFCLTGVQERFLASLEMTMRVGATLIFRLLETYFPTLFHTASALSAPSGHLPLEGKAFGAWRRYSRFTAFPMGKGFWTSPSFLWKEVPRRGGGWLPQRDETKSEIAHPPVSSSRAQPSIFLAGGKTVHMRKSVIPSRMKYGVYRSPTSFV